MCVTVPAGAGMAELRELAIVRRNIMARFEGKDGKRRLVEVFAEQELVQHNDTIANKLAADTALVSG